MKIFNISEGKFKNIVKKNLSLDMLYILCLVKEGVDVTTSFKDEAKICSLLSTLERKGYIHQDKLTELGSLLYLSLIDEEDEEVKVVKMVNKEDEWQEFLSYYPPNNKFIWRGRSFAGDRGIRTNTQKGKDLFTQITNRGISSEFLWRAVVAESIAKMEMSYKTGQNAMQYFVNTETYLRQQRYLNFLEDGKELTEEDISLYKEAFNRKKKTEIKKKNIDI